MPNINEQLAKFNELVKQYNLDPFLVMLAHKTLVEVARQGKFITYAEFAAALRLDLKKELYTTIRDILDVINRFEVAEGRPMITGLVVLKDSHPISPGAGFFILAMELGRWKKGVSKDVFYATELNAIKQQWQKQEVVSFGL